MNLEIDSRTDLLLLLLYASGPNDRVAEPITGITRLEKLLFLLQQETDIRKSVSELFEFEPYKFGPFTDALYDELEFLENLKLVKIEETSTSDEIDTIGEKWFAEEGVIENTDRSDFEKQKIFRLTTPGEVVAKKLFELLAEPLRAELSNVKKEYGKMPLRQLIRYVYSKYPDFTRHSIIK